MRPLPNAKNVKDGEGWLNGTASLSSTGRSFWTIFTTLEYTQTVGELEDEDLSGQFKGFDKLDIEEGDVDRILMTI
jgi:hypothetical protein